MKTDSIQLLVPMPHVAMYGIKTHAFNFIISCHEIQCSIVLYLSIYIAPLNIYGSNRGAFGSISSKKRDMR